MDLRIAPPQIELHPRQPLRMHAGTGRHLTAISGTTWLTIDGDPRDILLEPGDTHVFERPGGIVVQALGGEAQLIAEAGIEVVTGATARRH